MLDGDCFCLYGFSDAIFSDLVMTETFGCHVRGPEDASVVVVVNDCWFRAECGEKLPSWICRMWRMFFVHSSVAYISDSAVLLAVMVYRLDVQ